MKIFKHCHQWLKLIRTFALVLMLTAFVKSQVLAWSCPYHNSGGGDPDVLNYWFTSKLKRPSEMDAFISQCGGRLNYKNLDTSIDGNQYRTFWDYRTLDSGGCTHKEWTLYMRKTACDGTMQHCRTGYISAADSFAKKCSLVCERYAALTGNSCSTIVYQDTVGIFDEKGETFEDKPLKWATPAKEALQRCRRAVSDVNQLVKTNFDDLENSEVPDPNGNNHDSVLNKLSYIENNADRSYTYNFDSKINDLQSIADVRKNTYDRYNALYSNGTYDRQWRYFVSYNDRSSYCSTNQNQTDCANGLKNKKDSYYNQYYRYYYLANYGTASYSGSNLYIRAGSYEYNCGSNTSSSSCLETIRSNRDYYYKLWDKYYDLYYYGNYTYEWWYYFHYNGYSWPCSTYTDASTCRSRLATYKNDAYKQWQEAEESVEAVRQYRIELPTLREELKQAIQMARASLSYYEQVKGRNQTNDWARDLCPDSSVDNERCTIRKLMEGCFRAVNNRLITGGTSEYATNGQIYGGQESRNSFCNSPHSNLAYLNTGSCEKFGCYRYEKDCREVNEYYVEVDESCDVSNFIRYVPASETGLGRQCKECGNYKTCAQAAAYDWYYDSYKDQFVHGLNWKNNPNGNRYWPIRTSCPDGSAGLPKKLPNGQSCIVACRKPCNQVRDTTGQFMKEVGSNACDRDEVGIRVNVVYMGMNYQCISHCENACTHNHLYSQEQVFSGYGGGGHCASDSSLATDGALIRSHKRGIYTENGVVYCYDALCPAPPITPSYPAADKCEAYGYYSFDNIAAQCETGESEVCPKGEIVYTSEGRPIKCSCGCKTKTGGTPDLTCSRDKNTDSKQAGDLYENRTEMFYRERNAWLTWRGERIRSYDAAGQVVYAPKAYYRAGTTAEDIQVCRWKECAPNDAAAFASRNAIKSYCPPERQEYGYRDDGCGHVERFVRRCITPPSDNACSASSGSYFTSTRGSYGLYYRGRDCNCGPQFEWICTGKDDENCRLEEIGCNHCPPACVNECGNSSADDVFDCRYGFYEVDCLGPGGKSKTTDDCGIVTHGTKACQAPVCETPGMKFQDDDRTNYMKCFTAIDLDTTHHDQAAYFINTPMGKREIKPGYGIGGYYECAYGQVKVNTEDASHPECTAKVNAFNDTGEKQCFDILSCNKKSDGRGGYTMDTAHAQEYSGKKANLNEGTLFIPGTKSTNYRVGERGRRCGLEVVVTKPQWTIANYDSKANGSLSSAGTDDNMSDGRCGGGSSSIAKLNNADFTDAAKNDFSYKYFADKVEIDKLPDCQAVVKRISEGNYSDKDAEGFYICQIKGITESKYKYNKTVRDDSWPTKKRVSTSMLGAQRDDPAPDGENMTKNSAFFAPETNFIIFVTEGDFLIDTNIYTAPGHFKAIIARDTITIDPGVGTLPAQAWEENKGCRSPYTADLQGFFAAKQFIIPNWRVADPDLLPFNGDLYCDRQLAVAGTMLQWSKDENGAELHNELNLPRTFGACVGGKETKADWEVVKDDPRLYPKYNDKMSPHLFYSRPDFNTSAPSWMKDPHVQRYEVAI